MKTPEKIKSIKRFRKYTRRFFMVFYNLFFKRQKKKPPPEHFDSIIILLQEKLGDGILMMPLLNTLNREFPSAKIDVIASKYNHYLFENIEFIRNVFIFKKNHGRLFRALKNYSYDIFYNPKDHASLTATTITRKIDAKYKIGFDFDNHNKFYNILLENPEEMRIIEKNAKLLELFDIDTKLDTRLHIPKASYEYIDSLKMISNDTKYAAINLSPGAIKRKWTVDGWSEICRFILDKGFADEILMIAMPRDEKDANKIKEAIGDRIIYPIATRNLFDAAIVIEAAEFLVSPDTSLIHIAAMAGTKVIGLYSSNESNIQRFAPYNIENRVIKSEDNLISSIPADSVKNSIYDLFG